MATRRLISNTDMTIQHLPEKQCGYQSVPAELGDGASRFYQLEDDFQLITTDYTLCTDLSIRSRIETDEPRMVVTLGLKGNSAFITTEGNHLQFAQGYTSITTFTDVSGERRFPAGTNVLQLRFSVGFSWLTQHFDPKQIESLDAGRKIKLISHRPISVAALPAAQNLLRADVVGPGQALFRQGLGQAIVASELSAFLMEDQTVSQRFGLREQAIAQQVRDILYSEFKCPPTVSVLARRVGTNTSKLKQLIRQFFDTTPYGIVLERRMHHAHDLLKTENYSIAMVAEAVGYQHASNFSAAFMRYFGYSPKFLKKDFSQHVQTELGSDF